MPKDDEAAGSEASRTVARKLQQPQLRGARLDRPHLIAALDGVLGRRVALVCAPAGFGKTWLVLDWLRSRQATAQAWVSIDEHDNDASRLVTNVAEAIRRAISGPDVAAITVDPVAADPDRVVDGVAHTLEIYERDVIVVLDDAHLIQSPSAVELVERLIATFPSNVPLVLICRHDPMPNLSRLRLSGELVELRADDLRLTADEAATLVATLFDAPVSDAVVEDFRLRTGGWMAAFRLAALAVGSASNPDDALARLGGGETVFAEYVVPEMLDRIEPELRTFMLETSLLDELCGDACDAVTERDGSDAMLARIANGHTFALEIDEAAGCYLHHDLIRDVLRAELVRAHPERIPELHRRAGEWLHDHGDVVGAIKHMLAADRPDLASDWLVAASVSFLASGQTDTLMTLGRAVARSSDVPPLSLLGTMAAAEIVANTPGPHDEMLRSFEERLAAEVAAGVASDLAWDWPGFVYVFHQDPEELLAIVRATRANRDGDFDAIEAQAGHPPTESGIVEGIVGRVLACRERYSDAEGPLQTFRKNQAAGGHPLPHIRSRAAGLLALAWASAGGLTEAQELAESADADLRTTGHDRIPPVPEVSLALGEVAWERGELEAATDHVASALIRSSDLGEVAGHSLAAILRGHIRGSRGDRFAAELQLRQAIAMPHGRIVSPYFLDRIAFARATLALQDDDLLGAELAVPDWRDRFAHGAASMRAHLLHIRFVIVAGQDPTSLLDDLPDGCEVTVSHRIQLGLLRSLAAIAAGDERAAVDELSAQLQLAAHTGHRQRFLDERAALGAALEEAAARNGAGFFADAHTPTDHIARGGADRIELRDAKSLAETLVVFVEPLTYRELEVLRLLPSHRSYREIGAELYVSVNTVKYHVKAIYRKLGADGRADAVRIAEHRGMVAASG